MTEPREFSPEERLAIARESELPGMDMHIIAEKYGVNPMTIYDWRQAVHNKETAQERQAIFAAGDLRQYLDDGEELIWSSTLTGPTRFAPFPFKGLLKIILLIPAMIIVMFVALSLPPNLAVILGLALLLFAARHFKQKEKPIEVCAGVEAGVTDRRMIFRQVAKSYFPRLGPKVVTARSCYFSDVDSVLLAPNESGCDELKFFSRENPALVITHFSGVRECKEIYDLLPEQLRSGQSAQL